MVRQGKASKQRHAKTRVAPNAISFRQNGLIAQYTYHTEQIQSNTRGKNVQVAYIATYLSTHTTYAACASSSLCREACDGSKYCQMSPLVAACAI